MEIYKCVHWIKKELQYQKELKTDYEKQMKDLPDDLLSSSVVKGKRYYYKGDRRNRIFLGKEENTEVRQLQKRRLLEKTLMRIDTNCRVMEDFLKRYQSIEPKDVLKNQSLAYQSAEDLLLIHKAAPSVRVDENPFFPEGKKYKTLKGDLVRSKQEQLIADALFLAKVEYVYEPALKVGNRTFYPDFKIYVPSKKRFIYWEHMGMTNDSAYMRKAMDKFRWYIENGFVPWQDIIFTFSDGGAIDSAYIDQIIESFCR